MKELIVTALLGISVGHFGTDLGTTTTTAATAVQTSPQATRIELTAPPTPLRVEAAIKQDVEAAAANLEAALEAAPAMPQAMAKSIHDHGVVRTLLYTNPDVQSAADRFALRLGNALGALSRVLVKDMVGTPATEIDKS